MTLSEPADHPIAFDHFVQYLYTDNYYIDDVYEPAACIIHAMTYLLADRLIVEGLKALAWSKLTELLGDKTREIHVEVLLELIDVAYSVTYPGGGSEPGASELGQQAEGIKGEAQASNNIGENAITKALKALGRGKHLFHNLRVALLMSVRM